MIGVQPLADINSHYLVASATPVSGLCIGRLVFFGRFGLFALLLRPLHVISLATHNSTQARSLFLLLASAMFLGAPWNGARSTQQLPKDHVLRCPEAIVVVCRCHEFFFVGKNISRQAIEIKSVEISPKNRTGHSFRKAS